MQLCRLIYSSYANDDLTYQDLKEIMAKSEVNNQGDGITGLLCYGDGMFLQILEGNRQKVSKTYHRIAGDHRHHTPALIECISIENRLFGNWSMRAVKLGELNNEVIRNLILKYSESTTFEPQFMSPQQCLSFMEEMAVLLA